MRGSTSGKSNPPSRSRSQPSPGTSDVESSSQPRLDQRAGTRTVSTLSAAQLERKRANDREAQRIIRQRTREHIETLERRVTELDEQKQQLDRTLLRNAELEAQVVQLQRQLSELSMMLHYQHGHEMQPRPEMPMGYGARNPGTMFASEGGLGTFPPSLPSTTGPSPLPTSSPYDSQMAASGYVSYMPTPSSSATSISPTASLGGTTPVFPILESQNVMNLQMSRPQIPPGYPQQPPQMPQPQSQISSQLPPGSGPPHYPYPSQYGPPQWPPNS